MHVTRDGFTALRPRAARSYVLHTTESAFPNSKLHNIFTFSVIGTFVAARARSDAAGVIGLEQRAEDGQMSPLANRRTLEQTSRRFGKATV